jgi:type IV pilus assembly protein PilY1
MKTRNLLLSTLTALVVGMSGISQTVAKDTDIYLMAPQVARDDAPNVMIVLDNSGSMDTIIDATQIGYDPSINYCTDDLNAKTGIANANAGKPGTCASISGRIYWSFAVPGELLAPPAMNSSDWFASSKNYCLQSTSSFNSAGFYGTTRIAGWRSGSGNGWKTLKNKDNSTITYVDCWGDSDAIGTMDGQAVNDNKYPRSSTSTAYATSGTAFNWNNFTSDANPTLYTSNYMNYWHNPNLVDQLSRIDVAKTTVKAIIDANPSLRFGLTVFNDNNQTPNGGRVVMRIDTMDDTRRTVMKNIVDSLTAETFTPLAETMWEVYRYYAGLGATYGNPSPVQTPHQDSCAQNVANAACANGGRYDAIAAGNSAYNDGTYISPFKYGCQTAYAIYVTDGDPTNDTNADASIVGLTGASCTGGSCLDELTGWIHDHDIYSGLPGNQVVTTYTVGFGGGISAAGLALLQDAATKGGGRYYTANNTTELATALQGALTDILQVNTSFTSPSLSINAFNKLYNRDELYFAFFKPSSSVAWDGNVKKFTLCNITQSTAGTCTFGDIIDRNGASAIDSSSKIKDTAVSYWATTTTKDGAIVTQGGAGSHVPDANTTPIRKVYTYTGSYSSLTASTPATPFLVDTASTNTLRIAAVADPTVLGMPPAATPTEVDNLIKWMLSQDTYDQWTTVNQYNYNKKDNSSATDARWAFADPLHSRPAAITFGFEPTLLGAPDPNKPIIKLFVGTNDGALHMINSDTGAEEWVFYPKEMLSQQYALSQGADGDHIVGLDGAPSFWIKDINNDGIIDPAAGDTIYMYIGMRRGGRNIYAFDITPTSTKMTSQSDTVTPKLMWVIEGGSGSYTKLGQTWSRPTVARIRYACVSSAECNDDNPNTDDTKSRSVLLFGGGYDTNQDNGIPAGTDSMGNAIFMADPLTGSRLWWASSDSSANLVRSDMQYSIPSDLTVIDTDGDGRMDRIYVGDTSGQIWRLDLATDIATGTNGSTGGYVFADAVCARNTSNVRDCSSVSNQNWRKFFYPPDVAPVEDTLFSANSLYDLVTIVSGDREDPLDILTSNLSPVEEAVHNRIYAFRDIDYQKGPPGAARNAITDTLLYDATSNTLGTLTGTALQTEINTNFKNKKGWFIDLKESAAIALPNGLTTAWVGEKGLAKTTIFEGVLNVTTFTPSNDTTATATCAASEGVAKVYALNFLDGTPGLDLNNDGAVDRSVAIGGGIPSEVVVIVRPGGSTGLVNVSGGSTQVPIGQSPGPQKSYWHD